MLSLILQDKLINRTHGDPPEYHSHCQWGRCQCKSQCGSRVACVVHTQDYLASKANWSSQPLSQVRGTHDWKLQDKHGFFITLEVWTRTHRITWPRRQTEAANHFPRWEAHTTESYKINMAFLLLWKCGAALFSCCRKTSLLSQIAESDSLMI